MERVKFINSIGYVFLHYLFLANSFTHIWLGLVHPHAFVSVSASRTAPKSNREHSHYARRSQIPHQLGFEHRRGPVRVARPHSAHGENNFRQKRSGPGRETRLDSRMRQRRMRKRHRHQALAVRVSCTKREYSGAIRHARHWVGQKNRRTHRESHHDTSN